MQALAATCVLDSGSMWRWISGLGTRECSFGKRDAESWRELFRRGHAVRVRCAAEWGTGYLISFLPVKSVKCSVNLFSFCISDQNPVSSLHQRHNAYVGSVGPADASE